MKKWRSDESLWTKQTKHFIQSEMEAGMHSSVEQEFDLWQPLR